MDVFFPFFTGIKCGWNIMDNFWLEKIQKIWKDIDASVTILCCGCGLLHLLFDACLFSVVVVEQYTCQCGLLCSCCFLPR